MASITTIEDLKSKIQVSLADLNSLVEEPQIAFAADQAVDELDLTFPISSGSLRMWAVLRGKRHALDLLRTTSAYKFRYKQIHLNQRFEQLTAQIKQMDEDFKEALKNDPELMGADIEKAFGTYIENGFIYDQFGRDITRVMSDLGEDNEGYRERYI